MIPVAPNFRLLFFAFFLLIFDFCCAYPSPYSHTWTVFPRQQETTLTSPVTVTTTQTITTDVGIFIQTCTITLTPIVVDGQDMVREEKTCEVTPFNGNSSALPPPTISTSTSDTLLLTSSTGVSSNTVPPDSTVTSLPPASSGSLPPPVDSITLTSVPRPTDVSSVSLLPTSTSSGNGDAPPSSTVFSSVPNPTTTPQLDNGTTSTTSLPPPSLSSSQSSSTPSPTVSPTASSENSGAAFDPPGKKLEVLPIGLGVFAGVSVIALFVVGIVTYERTKHRRNFRRRREEEANNRMGYGTV